MSLSPPAHSVIEELIRVITQNDFALASDLLHAAPSGKTDPKSSQAWLDAWEKLNIQLLPLHSGSPEQYNLALRLAIQMAQRSSEEPVVLARMLQRALEPGDSIFLEEILSRLTPEKAAQATAHNQNTMSVPIAIAARIHNASALVRLLKLNPDIYGSYALWGSASSIALRHPTAAAVIGTLLEVLPDPEPWLQTRLAKYAQEDPSRSAAIFERLPPSLQQSIWSGFPPPAQDILRDEPFMEAWLQKRVLTDACPSSTTVKDVSTAIKPFKM